MTINNKKLIICFVIMVAFNSCQTNKTAHFEILNDSNQTIDSIKISCSGTDYKQKTTVRKIIPNQSEAIILDMNEVKKVDGNYFMELYVDNHKKVKAFGYYSNGMPSNSVYSLLIKNDTILIREYRK